MAAMAGPPVLRSIATNRLLKATLEEILGENPALIAFSVIVAHEGSGDQIWHLDKMSAGSVVQYSESFIPNYALLIPLQDTPSAMGATGVCPGTHRCNTVEHGLEQEHGFRVQPPSSPTETQSSSNGDSGTVDSESHQKEESPWKAGDGLLYHAQLRHRGSSNLVGPDRAVLILTLASKPDSTRPSVYTRLLPLGATFALRWDMWGFCMRDMEDAVRHMTNPVWRALGLTKEPDADWGWDYVRTVCHQARNDNGLGAWVGYLEEIGQAWWINLLNVNWDQTEDDSIYEMLFVGIVRRLRMVGSVVVVLLFFGYY